MMTLIGYSDLHFVNEVAVDKAARISEDESDALIEQARWGDGESFVKLTDMTA